VARPHAAQIVQDRLRQGNPAFLVPLADHAQQPVGAVDRRDLKGGRLADAQAYMTVKHALWMGLLIASRSWRTCSSDRAAGSRFCLG
jgi:hypothetical protein